jgi:hypothetical protein
MSSKIEITPITQKEANAFVKLHHRHHKPVVGSVFQIACAKDGKIVGVVIVGRPVSRKIQEYSKAERDWTLEVNRLCTVGEKNVCSMLYQAAWRVAKNLGYKRLITYILSQENGISLYAAGWHCVGEAGGGNWNVSSRPRFDTEYKLQQTKLLFERRA